MARVNLGERVSNSWDGNWPPSPGDKVRLWNPKELRGKTVAVVANDSASKGDIKVAPEDKIRVRFKDDDGEFVMQTLTARDAMPTSVKLKDIETAAA